MTKIRLEQGTETAVRPNKHLSSVIVILIHKLYYIFYYGNNILYFWPFFLFRQHLNLKLMKISILNIY